MALTLCTFLSGYLIDTIRRLRPLVEVQIFFRAGPQIVHLHWSKLIKLRCKILEYLSASEIPKLDFIFWKLDPNYLGFVNTG